MQLVPVLIRFFPVLASVAMLMASCRQQDTLFTALPAGKTGISFANHLEAKPHLNILYYLYYYNGGGVATGDVNGDGLADVYFTANSRGNNKLYLNKGDNHFEDVTAAAGVAGTADWCSGVTMADVNGDGLLDIYVSVVSSAFDLSGHNLLYINNGIKGGVPAFTERSAEYGLAFSGLSTQAAFFDYDHDGDLDCYLLNHSQQPHANVVDTVNRRKKSALSGDVLYRNELNTGQMRFTDVSEAAGIYQSNLGYGLGLAVADFNNDGWEDIYVGNDFHENDYYYLNRGDGSFSEKGASHFGHYSRFSMGNDAADYNNDGQMDLITVDMLPPEERVLKTYGSDENPDTYQVKLMANGYQHQYSRNALHRNNGNGHSFSEVGLLAGLSATDWSWCPLFADFDNDGNKDVFISSGIVKRPVDLDYVRFISDLQLRKGLDRTDKYDNEALESMPDGASRPFLFQGDGKGSFKDMSAPWGTAALKGYFNGASLADLDNDGNLDVIINQLNGPALVLHNKAPKKAFLSIRLKGDNLNKDGIGAKVFLFQKKQLQYQQLMATRGFQSSSDTRLHFGLDTLTSVDSLLVVWPDQRYQVLTATNANRQLVLHQKNASGIFDYERFFPPPKETLTEASDVTVPWTHRENHFLDFNVQYLIPHAQSTRGPKIAVGDINGDGLDDFYACGAAGQPGALMQQEKNGSFRIVDEPLFGKDANSEEVDALFFDANNDGHLDLYVVVGGNEAVGNDSSLLDRLYINGGNGRFVKSSGGLPPLFANKSCVGAADIDRDGDQDLFVGTLADARAYGVPQTSHLLLNDGSGKFSVATAATIPLQNIGMVSSAVFTDVNHDSWPDLIVAGEWMPVTIFMNEKGKFRPAPIGHSTGWWQTVWADDVNNDGHTDLLLGNWGLNNKFSSGKDGPVKLYVSDFDKNGSVDQLLSYTVGGKEYPFLAKDEAERALPVLRKHYLLYGDFAGLEMKDAYYGFAEQVKPLEAERLGSALAVGDGKGGFTLHDLPADLQLAPIFSFEKLGSKNGQNQFLCGGNFFDVIPYEGRYDAQPLALFTVSRGGAVTVIPQPGLVTLQAQVRSVKQVRITDGNKILLVAENNGPIRSFKIND